MLESIRKHSKFVMILLFLLIIPSFIFVGVDQSYFSGSSPIVAKVDGQEISQTDWDNAHRAESDRLRAQQPGMDAKLLDSPQARYATLERLVRDRVLQVAVRKMHLATGDAELARALQDIPAIANLRKPDGSLDADGYRALLASQGMTPEGFEASMRNDMSLGQVVGNVMGTSLTTPAIANAAMDAFLEQREIQVARFDAAAFAGKVQPSDAELNAYYQAHLSKFQQSEQANIEYVVLDLAAVRDGITLSEDDLRTYYKENGARFAGAPEERRASHILINAGPGMPAAEREAAKVKAQALVDRLKADPSSFSELAKTESQDLGSAVQGGDLGFFARGAMVAPFEQAAFAMNKGAISDVVESEFGFHVIQLTDIKLPAIPAFESVRAQIEAELKEQQAQRKYAEVAEVFANTVYEQAESLAPVVQKLGLKLHTANGVAREPLPAAQGVLAHEAFLNALFAADSLDNKRNTDAVEIGSNQMVAGRVLSYMPAKQLTLDEVKGRVMAELVLQQATAMAKAQGESKLKEWQSDASLAQGLLPAVVVARNQAAGMPTELIDAALAAPTTALPAWVGVNLGKAGYAVVKVNRIVARADQGPAFAEQAQAQFVQVQSTAEAAAYYEILKKKVDVQFKVPKP